MRFNQTIFGKIPSKSNQYRIIKIGQRCSLKKSIEVKNYEYKFAVQYKKHPMIINDFGIKINVFFESNRPDLDNCFKVLFDSLQIVRAIKNDNKCVEIIARKHKDQASPRIEFEIYEI